jgi:hypothetical protein
LRAGYSLGFGDSVGVGSVLGVGLGFGWTVILIGTVCVSVRPSQV